MWFLDGIKAVLHFFESVFSGTRSGLTDFLSKAKPIVLPILKELYAAEQAPLQVWEDKAFEAVSVAVAGLLPTVIPGTWVKTVLLIAYDQLKAEQEKLAAK